MEIFRKQNTATHVTAPLIDSANRPYYKSSPSLTAGDIKILRHTSEGGGTWNVGNIGSLPVEIGSTGMLDFSLTATEVNPDEAAYPVVILCHDAADSEWDDQAVVIWTRSQDVADLAPEAGSNIAAIKAKTDLIPAAPAAVGDEMDLNATALGAISAAAGAINVDSTGGNLALTKAIEALVAACVGKAAYDPATGVVTFKGRNGTSTIVQVTCDGSGNRTASGLS